MTGPLSCFATQKVSSFDRGPFWKEAGLSLCPPSLGGNSPLLSLDKVVGGHRPRLPSHCPLSLLALLCPQPQFWLLEDDKSRVGWLSLPQEAWQLLCQLSHSKRPAAVPRRAGEISLGTLRKEGGGGGGAVSAPSQPLRPTGAREGSRPAPISRLLPGRVEKRGARLALHHPGRAGEDETRPCFGDSSGKRFCFAVSSSLG